MARSLDEITVAVAVEVVGDAAASDGDRLQIFKGRPKGLSAASAVTVTPRVQGSTQIVAVADFDGDKPLLGTGEGLDPRQAQYFTPADIGVQLMLK